MPFPNCRIKAVLRLSLVLSALLLLPAVSSASKTYNFTAPEKGSLVLSVTGNGVDFSFDDGFKATGKADLSLTLNYYGWRYAFTGTMLVGNKDMPGYDFLKLGDFGLYFDTWRLTSTHDKLTINAGNTYTLTPFNRYLYTTSLYGGTGQISFSLPDTLKDTTATLYAMGGKNLHRKSITNTTLGIGGGALELDYKNQVKFEAQYMIGKNPTYDIKLGASKLSYMFGPNTISLDGALSEEKNKDKKGWQSTLGYSTTFENKNKLNANITYASSGFTKVTPYPSYVGGMLSAGADLAIPLTPVVPGSQTLTLRGKVSKDNMEKINPSSQYVIDTGFTYSASGFAPSSSGYLTYALTKTINDAKPKTVDQTRHSVVLSYTYKATEGKTTFNSTFYVNPQITFYHISKNVYFYVYEKGTFSFVSERSLLTGSAEITTSGYKNTGVVTTTPVCTLLASTDIPNTAFTISATGKLSGKTTYNYNKSLYVLDAYALELTPEVAFKLSENFTVKMRYLAKYAFGQTEAAPGWSGRIGFGLGFKI